MSRTCFTRYTFARGVIVRDLSFEVRAAKYGDTKEIDRASSAEKEIRNAWEPDVVDAMHRPIGLRQAYGLMGLLLGLFPPAALFWKIFGYGVFSPSPWIKGLWFLTPMFVAMNLACAAVGYLAADMFRRNLTRPRAGCGILGSKYELGDYVLWRKFLFLLPFVAAFWGLITGGAGGVLFFGFGIVFGSIIAIPVGVLGMTAFGISHRILQRDGMIELRQLLPVALGIASAITAFILGAPIGPFR